MILLGLKIGMSVIFDKAGIAIPVTIIKSGPCTVIQIKTKAKDGYDAIQVGYKELSFSSKLITKPLLGHFKSKGLATFQYIKEFHTTFNSSYTQGQILTLKTFKIGEKVNLSGITIGKGNAGNIKQHHFNSGPTAHGSKHKRLQGSLGAGTSPGRVFPGKKMPRRYGAEKKLIKNLQIMHLNLIENLITIKGSIPGKKGNLVSLMLA